MRDDIEDKTNTSFTINLRDSFFSLTLNYATEFLFGSSFGDSVSTDEETYRKKRGNFGPVEAFNVALKWLAKRGAYGDFYWLVGGREFNKCCNSLHEFVDSLIMKALKNRSLLREKSSDGRVVEHKVFLNALLEETQDTTTIRNNLLAMLLAGRDTTASFLGWVFYVLARNPQVLKTLQDEVSNTIGIGSQASPPTYEQLSTMKYLNCVLDESNILYHA